MKSLVRRALCRLLNIKSPSRELLDPWVNNVVAMRADPADPLWDNRIHIKGVFL